MNGPMPPSGTRHPAATWPTTVLLPRPLPRPLAGPRQSKSLETAATVIAIPIPVEVAQTVGELVVVMTTGPAAATMTVPVANTTTARRKPVAAGGEVVAAVVAVAVVTVRRDAAAVSVVVVRRWGIIPLIASEIVSHAIGRGIGIGNGRETGRGRMVAGRGIERGSPIGIVRDVLPASLVVVGAEAVGVGKREMPRHHHAGR